ncbi:methyltransferase domain protein [Aeromicrobium marinum DSM 15272]|uniref:Methyltransferase domain protein n=1 Tax=Aeromicrobium marinum DSM 15272 TaxID=585531 RepID=E2SBA6_9ACTN|nr:class I SAM-dependent methyltransferase [Aeromicrobium marinum]EFQ83652.1 methyltransferase domain protein [Aeromicrobium marinum DSM 15272]
MSSHDHAAFADLLDLETRAMQPTLHGIHLDLQRLSDGPVRSVLDLGAGTGAGTLGLLDHFPHAVAVAVDASGELLDRLRDRATERGLAGRVTTVVADLDGTVPALEPVDVAWASASLHHLAAPDRALRTIASTIRPGGLLAVVEMAGFPRFVPDGTPGGSAEERAHAVLRADREVDMPAMGADWGPALEQAGLAVEVHRPLVVDVAELPPGLVGEYAFAGLSGIRRVLAGRLGSDRTEGLDRLLDGGPDDVRQRRDLHVEVDRQLWIARRPH